MKKSTLLILFMVCSLFTKAQQTSMVIDNQTPGWLSSKINYGDQLTVENLTVTGYINGTDIQFIRDLNLNRNLHGIIDLTNVHLVKGGVYYGKISNCDTPIKSTVEKDDVLPWYAFTGLKPLKKFIFPNTLVGISTGITVDTPIDTIIVTKPFDTINLYDISNELCGYVELPEGVKNIIPSACVNGIHLLLPSTTTNISSQTMSNCTIYSYIQDPTKVKAEREEYTSTLTSSSRSYYASIDKSTFYIPKGTKVLYLESDFATKPMKVGTWNSSNAPNENKFIEVYDVDSVLVSCLDKNYYVGDTIFLESQVFPDANLVSFLDYKLNNGEIGELLQDGAIKCLQAGKLQVVVSPHFSYKGLTGNPGICNISIIEHVSGIEMQSSCAIKIGESFKLNAQTKPLGTTDNKITYFSSDDDIATVDEHGVIYGVKKGSCIVTAKSVDGGYTAECVVTVMQSVEQIKFAIHSIELKKGETKQLNVDIHPLNADNKELKWNSSDELTVKVNNNGFIESLKTGFAYIYATSLDNTNAIDSCLITVIQDVEGIKFNINEYTFNSIGQSIELIATITPEDATNKQINWKSSNENVCVVSNGKVVAVGYGTAVIIATTADGGHMATCTIVVEDATGINEINTTNEEVKIYDVQGRPSTLKTKGVKIIRFADGTSMKIVIK